MPDDPTPTSTELFEQPSETEPALRVRRYSADSDGPLVEFVDEDSNVLATIDRTGSPSNSGSTGTPIVFAPARLAEYSTNIDLTGPATIDSVPVVTGDRILLRGQDDPIEDGLWVANTAGAWTRPADFVDGTVVVNGSMFIVGYAGNVWVASMWLLNTDDGSGPNVVGTNGFDNIDPVFAYNVFSINGPGAATPGTFSAGVFGSNSGVPALVAYGATLFDLGTPTAPLDGLTLFVDSGVLKYRLPNGDVKTVTVT